MEKETWFTKISNKTESIGWIAQEIDNMGDAFEITGNKEMAETCFAWSEMLQMHTKEIQRFISEKINSDFDANQREIGNILNAVVENTFKQKN